MIIRSQPVICVITSLLPVSKKFRVLMTDQGPSSLNASVAAFAAVVAVTWISISSRNALEGTLYWSRGWELAVVVTVRSHGSSSTDCAPTLNGRSGTGAFFASSFGGACMGAVTLHTFRIGEMASRGTAYDTGGTVALTRGRYRVTGPAFGRKATRTEAGGDRSGQSSSSRCHRRSHRISSGRLRPACTPGTDD